MPGPILFKLSVRLQGGPKRAAHAAAWARVPRLADAHDGHASSPSAGVQKRIEPRRRQRLRKWAGSRRDGLGDVAKESRRPALTVCAPQPRHRLGEASSDVKLASARFVLPL
jgi:hypothetical protein